MRSLFASSTLALLVACSAPGEGPAAPALDPSAEPGLALGALDGAARTIPYGGYVDFDGEPVNAGNVGFNFALFPCATPGTGAGGCSALWVAKGTWTNAATWTSGWPTGIEPLRLPIFSGRFAVELGGVGQAPLPEAAFESGAEVLYLGIQIEGRALGTLQKIAPAFKAVSAHEGDRLRVRSAVEIDDPSTGGSATLAADHGLVVGHSAAGLASDATLLRVENGAGETPLEVRADGTVLAGRYEGDGSRLRGAVQVVADYTNVYFQGLANFSNGDAAQNWDDTIPQRAEGIHVAEVTLTPASADNLLVVDATFHGVELTNRTDHLAICVFRGASQDALACAVLDQNFNGGDYSGLTNTVHLHHVFPAGTTSALSLELRAGFVAGPADAVLCMNGGGGSRRLGGTLHSGLTVKEYR